MITNLLFCISSQDVTCLHVLQAPRINALCGRGTHSAATTSRLCRLMRTCIAAIRKVSHVFIYKYVYKVSGAHAPLGPTVDTPLLSSHRYVLLCTLSYTINIHNTLFRIFWTIKMSREFFTFLLFCTRIPPQKVTAAVFHLMHHHLALLSNLCLRYYI